MDVKAPCYPQLESTAVCSCETHRIKAGRVGKGSISYQLRDKRQASNSWVHSLPFPASQVARTTAMCNQPTSMGLLFHLKSLQEITKPQKEGWCSFLHSPSWSSHQDDYRTRCTLAKFILAPPFPKNFVRLFNHPSLALSSLSFG